MSNPKQHGIIGGAQSLQVDSLQRQVETLRSGFQSAQERADKEQVATVLDGAGIR